MDVHSDSKYSLGNVSFDNMRDLFRSDKKKFIKFKVNENNEIFVVTDRMKFIKDFFLHPQQWYRGWQKDAEVRESLHKKILDKTVSEFDKKWNGSPYVFVNAAIPQIVFYNPQSQKQTILFRILNTISPTFNLTQGNILEKLSKIDEFLTAVFSGDQSVEEQSTKFFHEGKRLKLFDEDYFYEKMPTITIEEKQVHILGTKKFLDFIQRAIELENVPEMDDKGGEKKLSLSRDHFKDFLAAIGFSSSWITLIVAEKNEKGFLN